jgi:hypothetical protein
MIAVHHSFRFVRFSAGLLSLACVCSAAAGCSGDDNHGPTIGSPTTPVVISEGGGGPSGAAGPSGGSGTTTTTGGVPGVAGTVGVGGTSDPLGTGGTDPFATAGTTGAGDPFGVGGSPSSFSGTSSF